MAGSPIDHNGDITIRHGFERAASEARRGPPTIRCDLLEPTAIDTLFTTGRGVPVVIAVRFGSGGRITLVSDGSIFTNQVLREYPSVTGILATAGLFDAHRFVFDEYHQGFQRTGSLMAAAARLLFHQPFGWTILQLTGVFLLYVLVNALRFGPALPTAEARRRSELEHVDALASGLARARAADMGARLLVAGLMRRLYGPSFRQTGGTDRMLVQLETSAHLDGDKHSVRRLATALQIDDPEQKIVRTAEAVEDVWKQLSHKR